MRCSEQLQAIASPIRPTIIESKEQPAQTVKGQERQKAMYLQTRQPERKVFAGLRHTKTLSLSNPTSTYYD